MQFKLTCFEVKKLGEDGWQEIPEKKLMEKLVDCFDPVTPALSKMLEGGEIATPWGILPNKNLIKEQGNGRTVFST